MSYRVAIFAVVAFAIPLAVGLSQVSNNRGLSSLPTHEVHSAKQSRRVSDVAQNRRLFQNTLENRFETAADAIDSEYSRLESADVLLKNVGIAEPDALSMPVSDLSNALEEVIAYRNKLDQIAIFMRGEKKSSFKTAIANSTREKARSELFGALSGQQILWLGSRGLLDASTPIDTTAVVESDERQRDAQGDPYESELPAFEPEPDLI